MANTGCNWRTGPIKGHLSLSLKPQAQCLVQDRGTVKDMWHNLDGITRHGVRTQRRPLFFSREVGVVFKKWLWGKPSGEEGRLSFFSRSKGGKSTNPSLRSSMR
jgi:hypothetical protein